MLPSTPEEKQAIIDYMNWQAPDLTVEFLQKVYVENVLSHQHVVWDVHTNADRWWVITNPGQTHEHRRHLFKGLLDGAWRFSNWLTHAKASTWHDAEAATTTVEHALGLAVSLVLRHLRGVPDACPACGSTRLSPQRGFHSSTPDLEFERPTCEKCGWVGDPVPILGRPQDYVADEEEREPPADDCVIPELPLRELIKPERKR
jgi:hypothetical protein